MEPLHDNNFSELPESETQLETENSSIIKFVIDKDIVLNIAEYINHMNINSSTLFPGLEGCIATIRTNYLIEKNKALESLSIYKTKEKNSKNEYNNSFLF